MCVCLFVGLCGVYRLFFILYCFHIAVMRCFWHSVFSNFLFLSPAQDNWAEITRQLALNPDILQDIKAKFVFQFTRYFFFFRLCGFLLHASSFESCLQLTYPHPPIRHHRGAIPVLPDKQRADTASTAASDLGSGFRSYENNIVTKFVLPRTVQISAKFIFRPFRFLVRFFFFFGCCVGN